MDLWPAYGCDYGGKLIDLERLFGRSASCMLEIGFGTGDALLEFATAHPDFDCLGIEVHRAGVGHLLLEIRKRGLTNIRVICHDAVEVLRQGIAPQSLSLIHIFFPDPWPKKRHHKRRLIQPPFVAALPAAMAPGAVLRLATDWEDYARQMSAACESNGQLLNPTEEPFAARLHGRPLTRFERRGQGLGHAIWDLEYRRRK